MYIPATQRPDGSWRKPIAVRSGYVPQEEQPLYVSKGRQSTEKSKFPVGLSSADVQTSSNNRVGYFEVGNYDPKPKAVIPGLNFAPSNNDEVEKKKKSKKKKPAVAEQSTGSGTTNNISKTSQFPAGAVVPASNKPLDEQIATDPAKRLRNLKKKLKDIETLQAKIKLGEVENPDPDQVSIAILKVYYDPDIFNTSAVYLSTLIAGENKKKRYCDSRN